ncbi:MAG: VWA domain-containing protein [Planctomycetales bacterium]|nr:VWA domain-containing protein [Planctomycetales bacterium]
MSLLNPALLVGLGLAAIPILLHLLVRAKPKRLVFPALRLILQRQKQNTRRMHLRHIWLLLLRILVVVLIVIALTRPSLPAANYSLTWFETGTLCGIVILAWGTYWIVMAGWRQRSMARNLFLTRRTLLRGGLGLAAGLMSLAGVALPYSWRVSGEWKAPPPKIAENVPVAAVLLFDTSSSMGYRQSNLTRLQVAQKLALEQIGRMPSGSKIAVTANGDTGPAAFSIDSHAAQNRIEGQALNPRAVPLNERLRAILLQQEEDRLRVTAEQESIPAEKRQDRFVREIYLFTDLAKSAWHEDSLQLLRSELERLKWVGVYLIDVGIEQPTNVALIDLKLSRESVPAEGSTQLDVIVSSVGQIKQDQTLEIYVRDGDEPLRKSDQQSVTLESGTDARVSLTVPIGTSRFRQGEVRLSGSDPLDLDNVLFFTLQKISALRVLVVAEHRDVASYWLQALATLTDAKIMEYRTEFTTTDRVLEKDLQEFDVVFLINGRNPSDAFWTQLREFVDQGGGAAVFLGADSSARIEDSLRDVISPVAYHSQAALRLLPGRLEASLVHMPSRTIDLRGSQHAFLQRLDSFGMLADFGSLAVRRYWKVEPVQDAVTVARYGGLHGSPALIERRLGQGRVLLMTTGVDGLVWNDLLDQNSGPLYIVLVDQLVQYLSSHGSETLNHLIGDEVSLRWNREQIPKQVVVRMPDFKQLSLDLPAESKPLTLRNLTAIGSYAVDAVDKIADFQARFSVNRLDSESDLRRLEPGQLNLILGEGRCSVSRDPANLERSVLTGRIGQEMYGLLVAILAVVFAMEQFTATWFYRMDND